MEEEHELEHLNQSLRHTDKRGDHKFERLTERNDQKMFFSRPENTEQQKRSDGIPAVALTQVHRLRHVANLHNKRDGKDSGTTLGRDH